jgi:hypothetical protein
MHRLIGMPLLLLAAVLPAATPGYPATWLRVQGGLLRESNSPCLKQASGYGAGIGMWLNRGVGWELDALSARLKDKDGLWTARELHLDLSLLFAPPADGAWKPFLRLGGGASRLDQPLALVPRASTRANVLGGVGLMGLVGAHGLLSLEARGTSVRTTTPRSELQYLVGLGLRWGGRAAPAAGPDGRDLFPQRPLVEPAGPGPGTEPAVRPAVPAPDRAPAVQPAAPGQGPAVQPAPRGQGSTVQPAPRGQGPALPLVRKPEP